MQIRTVRQVDDTIVTDLLLKAFSHLYTTLGLEMAPERRAYLSNQAARRTYSISFICEVDGLAVGTITLVPPSSDCKAWVDGAWELRLLAVDPLMQKRGVARKLVEHAERHVEAKGGSMVCLHARRGMEVQARFYPSCGYVRDAGGDIDMHPFQEGYRKDLRAE